MTNWRTLVSSSETLSADDLAGRTITAKIAAVNGGQFEGEDAGKAKTDRVALISFVGKEKKLAANTINCTLIEAMWGADVEAWAGHLLTIGPDKVEVAGSFYGQPCIRVKGSPDLERPITVSIALKAQGGRKRKPFDKHLVPTPRGPQAPEPQAAHDPDIDRIPFGDE
jgi:hypothetical protein